MTIDVDVNKTNILCQIIRINYYFIDEEVTSVKNEVILFRTIVN